MHIHQKSRILFSLLILSASAAVSWHFLTTTPAGCYAKAFTVGSSLCHQLPSHSFALNGIQFPLCARCTGLYLGSFIGLAYALFYGKKAGIPKKSFLFFLGTIFVIWGADGLNSLISDFLNRLFIYQTTNLTRTITGYGMGLVMATALATLFNITIWKDSENKAILRSPLQIGIYIILAAAMNLLVLSEILFLFRLAAFLAVFTALVIITLLYTVFWVILAKKENTFTALKDVWVFLAAGFTTAMIQITLLITLRSNILG